MAKVLSSSTFTPSEVANITGLSTAMQRDWRRRGVLPSSGKHARFDVVEVAGIWALKILSDRGIGPQTGKEVASLLSYGIAYHALRGIDFEEQIRKKLRAELKKLALEMTNKTFDVEQLAPDKESPWINETLKRLARSRGQKPVIPARFLIWWADGSYEWDELGGTVLIASNDRKWAGAVIVLDQQALGWELRKRAGKPLILGKGRP